MDTLPPSNFFLIHNYLKDTFFSHCGMRNRECKTGVRVLNYESIVVK